MFEHPKRGRQARNFTTNVPKILDFKSSSEQIFSKNRALAAPRPAIQLTQCCTQFKSPGVEILCVLCLHYNVAFTFK